MTASFFITVGLLVILILFWATDPPQPPRLGS